MVEERYLVLHDRFVHVLIVKLEHVDDEQGESVRKGHPLATPAVDVVRATAPFGLRPVDSPLMAIYLSFYLSISLYLSTYLPASG